MKPKNIDLVVGPSILTEETKKKITQAIAQYKKTGQKPVSVKISTQGSVNMTHTDRAKAKTATPERGLKRSAGV
jgi:hypothetical protein